MENRWAGSGPPGNHGSISELFPRLSSQLFPCIVSSHPFTDSEMQELALSPFYR